jgi:hypothetical protein
VEGAPGGVSRITGDEAGLLVAGQLAVGGWRGWSYQDGTWTERVAPTVALWIAVGHHGDTGVIATPTEAWRGSW